MTEHRHNNGQDEHNGQDENTSRLMAHAGWIYEDDPWDPGSWEPRERLDIGILDDDPAGEVSAALAIRESGLPIRPAVPGEYGRMARVKFDDIPETGCQLTMTPEIRASIVYLREDGEPDAARPPITLSPSLFIQGNTLWEARIAYTPSLDLTREQIQGLLRGIYQDDVREEDHMDWREREFRQKDLDTARVHHEDLIAEISLMLQQSPMEAFREQLRDQAGRGNITLRTPDGSPTTIILAGALMPQRGEIERMSAWYCPDDLITYLLAGGMELRRMESRSPLLWDAPGGEKRELTPGTFTQTGQMLRDLNVLNLRYLYDQEVLDDIMPAETAFRPTWYDRQDWYPFEPVQVIKTAHCYRYQCSNGRNWEDSEARELIETILDQASSRLEGYAGAEWGPPAALVTPIGLTPFCEVPECGGPPHGVSVIALQEGDIDHLDPGMERRSMDDIYILCSQHYEKFMKPRRNSNAETLTRWGVRLRPIGQGLMVRVREANRRDQG